MVQAEQLQAIKQCGKLQTRYMGSPYKLSITFLRNNELLPKFF